MCNVGKQWYKALVIRASPLTSVAIVGLGQLLTASISRRSIHNMAKVLDLSLEKYTFLGGKLQL